MDIVLFIILGLMTGVLAGLLGIGGGVITVPAMYYIFSASGFPQDRVMHVCIATALAATFITSLGSTWSHHKKQAIIPRALKIIGPGLCVGCIGGAILGFFLSSHTLQIFFGVMAIVFAIYFFFPKLPHLNIAPTPNKSLILFGLIIGALSSLLGVGGGIFMMPILLGYHLSLKNSVATSSAGTLITALVGSLIYLFIAYREVSLPRCVGFIDIPAFVAIGLGSLCTTSLGVKLSHTLSPALIKRIFAIALGITGLTMFLT